MEKIIEINRVALAKDEETYLEIQSRAQSTEAKKREVEDAIMKGLTDESNTTNGNGPSFESETGGPERPDFEAFTPPEATTPIGTPPLDPQRPEQQVDSADVQDILAGMSGGTSRVRPASGQGLNGSSAKRRKILHEDEAIVPDLGDLDQDVEDLLRQESARV